MPFEYSGDPARRQIDVTASDPVDLLWALEVLERQASERAWSHGALIDMRCVSWVPSAGDVHLVLERIRSLSAQYGRRGPVAFVTSENMALFGMIRMYSILAEAKSLDVTIDVFLTREEAAEWLDYVVDVPNK